MVLANTFIPDLGPETRGAAVGPRVHMGSSPGDQWQVAQ